MIATVEVDLSAIKHNVEQLKRLAPHSQFAAVVKANAYGHGSHIVAPFLNEQVDIFCVARLSEAIALRQDGITAPILVLGGFTQHDNLDDFVEYNLSSLVHSFEQIARLAKSTLTHPLKVWFKLDTGMHRLGFHPDQARAAFEQLQACACVCKPINILSHFCCADELDNALTTVQLARFDAFIAEMADLAPIGMQSIAASAGTLAWPQTQRDLVRPGIALYGVSPFDYHCSGKATGQQLGLRPAMTLKSELVAIREHQQGEGVGYGQIWHSPQSTTLGVIAMGYGDGYPRAVPANTPVLINGRRVPIVGRVAMDMIIVDLGLDSQDKLGDEVIFWGARLPVEEIAEHTGISAYELLTRLTNRAKFHYIK